MHSQDHRTEDKAKHLQAKKVVAVELDKGSVGGPRPDEQSARLSEKAVHDELCLLPEGNAQLDDVRDEAEGGQWTVKEERKETSLDGLVVKGRRTLLGRHEDDQRLPKVARDVLKGGTVVRVDDDEEGPSDEGIEVARVEAVDVLGRGRVPLLVTLNGLPEAGVRRYAAVVVANCKKLN